jgi:hypothetical protein
VSKWHLSSAGPTDMIIAACHSQTYLLLQLKSRRAVLLHEAAGGQSGVPHLQEVKGSGTILNPMPPTEAHIAACCLYHDTSGWLQSALQQLGSPVIVRIHAMLALHGQSLHMWLSRRTSMRARQYLTAAVA